MIKAAIVEDEAEEAQRLESYLKTYAENNNTAFEISYYESGVSFLANAKNYDVVFMDIEMPDLNGMETAKRLRTVNSSVALIFVTNMAQYAVDGYEVDALDFMVKPVSYVNFEMKLRRAVERINASKNDKIVINGTDGMFTVQKSDIKYVEIMSHDIIYHTTDGNISAYGTLKNVEALLGNGFFRCNSCYLVNLACVDNVRGYMATVAGETLPISHMRKKAFMQTLADYFGGTV